VQNRDLAGAVADFSRALELERNSAVAYHQRGATRLMQDDIAARGNA
jgi:hypothetical protein